MTITDHASFRSCLADTLPKVRDLAARYPNDPALGSIVRQLEHVDAWTSPGRKPTDDEVKKLTFGTLASRCVDDVDQDLAGALYALHNYLDDLAQKPN